MGCARTGAELARDTQVEPSSEVAELKTGKQPKPEWERGRSVGSQTPSARVKLGFVTNADDAFWRIALAGVNAAAREFDVSVDSRMPTPNDRLASQNRQIEELVESGVQGLAISPINPELQQELLNRVGERCFFVTHDADSPLSNRLAYVGMNNYDAGRVCGQLIKEASPEGGEVAILVGSLEQLNARLRRQGVIDELLDRTHDPQRFDPVAMGILKGAKYSLVDTRTDGFDPKRGDLEADALLARHPDLDVVVGLFSHNGPQWIRALKRANKHGQVRVVAFDEDDETLRSIEEGTCFATIVQDPYRYGFESIHILAGLARDDRSVLPANGFLEIKERVIRKENVRQFRDELAARLGR